MYAGARRVERMEHLKEYGIRPLAMDVTDDTSLQAAVAQIIDEAGRLDVLVNNAGYGSYGALEDVSQDEARRQFDVNVFGAVRLIQMTLPHMRAQRSGTVVNVTPMGGKIYTPLGGWYHGTKFALEALSDCLRIEVKPGGCAGLKYSLYFDHESRDGDLFREFHGLQLGVDRFSAPYLEGAVIDFVDTIQKQGFTIDNPNAGGSCACGDSFN